MYTNHSSQAQHKRSKTQLRIANAASDAQSEPKSTTQRSGIVTTTVFERDMLDELESWIPESNVCSIVVEYTRELESVRRQSVARLVLSDCIPIAGVVDMIIAYCRSELAVVQFNVGIASTGMLWLGVYSKSNQVFIFFSSYLGVSPFPLACIETFSWNSEDDYVPVSFFFLGNGEGLDHYRHSRPAQ